jgi:CBS domain-containing protein
MQVKEIMTNRVVTVTPDTPVPVIAGLLRDNRISGVPVTDAEDAVIGLVSEYGRRAGPPLAGDSRGLPASS